MQKRYVLLLIPFILYIGLLGIMPQMEPDEARYSLIPSAMNQSGNYVTPHIKNVVYLEKPPLVYWATAMSFKVFGENDFSARLFTALWTTANKFCHVSGQLILWVLISKSWCSLGMLVINRWSSLGK